MFSHSQFWGLVWRRDDERFHIYEDSWVQKSLHLQGEVGRRGQTRERGLLSALLHTDNHGDMARKWMAWVILLAFPTHPPYLTLLNLSRLTASLASRWALQGPERALPGGMSIPNTAWRHVSQPPNATSTYKKHNTRNIFFTATPTSNLFL